MNAAVSNQLLAARQMTWWTANLEIATIGDQMATLRVVEVRVQKPGCQIQPPSAGKSITLAVSFLKNNHVPMQISHCFTYEMQGLQSEPESIFGFIPKAG